MAIIYYNHNISFPSLPKKKTSLVRVEATSKRFCKNWSQVKFLPERTVSQPNGYYLISTICKSQIYAFKTSSLLWKNILQYEHFANITFKFVIVNSTWILWECVVLQCTRELAEITMQLKTKRLVYLVKKENLSDSLVFIHTGIYCFVSIRYYGALYFLHNLPVFNLAIKKSNLI